MRKLIVSLALTVMSLNAQEFEHTRVVKVPDLSFTNRVYTGLDILAQMDYRPLKGRSIAVLCNQASVDRNGRHILEILNDIEDVDVKYIFLPEHGLFGTDDDRLRMIGDKSFDPVTGARIVDLWGRYIKPPRWVLDDVDIVLIDIQDTGVRYTTYITTISKIMESCSDFDVPILLLDRPNPIRGDRVDGPVVRTAYQSFESYHLVPIRHGLTVGEFALMVNEMGWVKDLARANLVIIPVVMFYLLRDFDLINEKLMALVPPRLQKNSKELLMAIDQVLSRFVRGQLMVAGLMGVMYSAGLFLCDTPMSLSLGMMAGLVNLVPYLGLVLGFFTFRTFNLYAYSGSDASISCRRCFWFCPGHGGHDHHTSSGR